MPIKNGQKLVAMMDSKEESVESLSLSICQYKYEIKQARQAVRVYRVDRLAINVWRFAKFLIIFGIPLGLFLAYQYRGLVAMIGLMFFISGVLCVPLLGWAKRDAPSPGTLKDHYVAFRESRRLIAERKETIEVSKRRLQFLRKYIKREQRRNKRRRA